MLIESAGVMILNVIIISFWILLNQQKLSMTYRICILLMVLANSAFCQPGDLPANNKPGSCYAKCLMPNIESSTELHTEVRKYPVYIGQDMEKVKTKIVSIEVKPSIQSWEKKRKTNCKSKDENDCFTWCLTETPGEFMKLEVVKNKRKLDEEDWEYKAVEVLVSNSSSPPVAPGSYQWKEVLCNPRVTNAFKLALKSKLSEAGFEHGSINANIDAKTKSALTKYQKENELPVGQFDIETLESLGLGHYL